MALLHFIITILVTFTQVGVLAAPFDFFNLLQRRDDACNGDSALCSRKYSSVTFIGTHDSPFIGSLPTQNQEKSIQDQLNGGIRFLQSQIHPIMGIPYMCHTNCLLENGGSVEKYLTTIKSWLDSHPREVVSLLMTNPEHMDMSKWATIFKKVGADKYAFVPASSPNALGRDDWPTLGDLINTGKRLIVFVDYNANESSVPYILDQFNYFFEGPYDTTDSNFAQCDMDRQNKLDNSGASSMYLVNHYLDLKIGDMTVPDRSDASTTNAAQGTGSIGAQVDLCNQKWGRKPNVVLIDYFGRGNEINAQNQINSS